MYNRIDLNKTSYLFYLFLPPSSLHKKMDSAKRRANIYLAVWRHNARRSTVTYSFFSLMKSKYKFDKIWILDNSIYNYIRENTRLTWLARARAQNFISLTFLLFQSDKRIKLLPMIRKDNKRKENDFQKENARNSGH